MTTSGFPNPEFWLNDFASLSNRFSAVPYVLNLSVSVSEKIPSVNSSVIKTHKEGKYLISWYGDPNPAILWESNDNSFAKQLGVAELNNSSRKIDLFGTSENILGRWLRHFVIVPQYLTGTLFFLHAISVSKGGKTFIVMGGSGAGKTTCAYAALRNGWSVLADDTLLIQPSLKIIPFFSTVSWECRLRIMDKYTIDMALPSPDLHLGNLVTPLVDYKGRTIFFPQEHIGVAKDYDVSGIIWLYSNSEESRNKKNDVQIRDVYNDLGGRISMKSIFDLYGEDYFAWLSRTEFMISKVLSLPIHRLNYSSNLTQDVMSFVELIEKL